MSRAAVAVLALWPAHAAAADTTAPSGSVRINANAAYTKLTSVTLTLSATDNVGVTGYRLSASSTTPALTTSGWVTVSSTTSFSRSVSYTVSSGNGTKTVYAWYRDAAGRISARASDSIVLDQTLPTNGTLGATAGSSQVSLTWSGFADATSGLATTNTYKLVFTAGSTPTSCSSGTQLLLSTATTFTHSGLANGTTYFYRVCAFDKAGNMSSGAIASATAKSTTTASAPAPSQPTLLGFVPGVGTPMGVVVSADGKTAFVASDPFGVSTVNVQNPAAPVVLGSSDEPFIGQSVAVSGTRAVVTGRTANGMAHLWVVDMTSPTVPRVVGELTTTVTAGSGTGFQGVVMNSSGTLAVAGMGTSGIWVIDLSNPAAPRVRGTYNTPGTAQAVALNGAATVMYVADGTGDLQIVSLANPSAPTLLKSLSLNGIHVDIALVGSMAYLVNSVGTLTIVDVSVPTAPVYVTSRAAVGGAYGQRIAVEGTRAAVLASDSSKAWLQNWDISTPTNPRLLGSFAMGPVGMGKALDLVGGRVYVAAGTEGLKVYALGTGSPTWQGSADDAFRGEAVGVAAGRAVVAGQSTATNTSVLKVLDVNPPSDPLVTGQLSSSSAPTFTSVALNSAGTLAVVGRGAAGIQIVDITNPAAPAARGSYNTPGTANAIALNSTGTVAYVADGTGDLLAISLANPSAPTLLGSSSLNGIHVDIAVAGTMAYLVNSVGTLTVVNVAAPSAPAYVTSRAAVAGAYGYRIAVEGTRAAVLANDSSSTRLQSWDISIPSSPVFLGSVLVGPVGTGKGVALAGGRAYVAANTQGLLTYSVSGSGAPVLVNAVGTVGDALDIVVQAGIAYIADFPATITIMDVP